MSEIVEVSPDWLALREEADARSRSRELATAAAARLALPRAGLPHTALPRADGSPIVVHDLGSGTGSMMRWLAPQLPGPQTWVLHDWNATLTGRAAAGIRPRDTSGRPVGIRSRVGDLAELTADDLAGATLVTASALLDVLTSEELHAMVAACVAAGAPVLLSLSVVGRVELRPADPRDAVFAEAFNEHQRRLIGDRRPLGPYAVAVARGLFLEADWHVRPAETPWVLGPPERILIEEWFDGWMEAALEQRPELHREASDYIRLRMEQLNHGRLSVVVHHKDLLAWPR